MVSHSNATDPVQQVKINDNLSLSHPSYSWYRRRRRPINIFLSKHVCIVKHT